MNISALTARTTVRFGNRPAETPQIPLQTHDFDQFLGQIDRNPRLVLSIAELLLEMTLAENKTPRPFGIELVEAGEKKQLHLPDAGETNQFENLLALKALRYLQQVSPRNHAAIEAINEKGQEVMDFVALPVRPLRLKWVDLPDDQFAIPQYQDPFPVTPLHLATVTNRLPDIKEQETCKTLLGTMRSVADVPDANRMKFLFPEKLREFKAIAAKAARRAGLRTTDPSLHDRPSHTSHMLLLGLLKRYSGNWNKVLARHVRATEVELPAEEALS